VALAIATIEKIKGKARTASNDFFIGISLRKIPYDRVRALS
jgi:hypothetical protein